MIDNLISNLLKKFGLIRNCPLNVMNFLILGIFLENFLIFQEFIWIYFELKRIKKSDFIAC